MSKKDYVAVAAAIREQVDAWPPNGGEAVELVVAVLESTAMGLADAFEEDNPHFDRERFLAACGVSE